jgi:succinate dehydrogenase flavin-adding protein (antitoxin of CptAB toxin-antitoxin module)
MSQKRTQEKQYESMINIVKKQDQDIEQWLMSYKPKIDENEEKYDKDENCSFVVEFTESELEEMEQEHNNLVFNNIRHEHELAKKVLDGENIGLFSSASNIVPIDSRIYYFTRRQLMEMDKEVLRIHIDTLEKKMQTEFGQK